MLRFIDRFRLFIGKKGFTLLEVLIVISITAIIAGMIFVTLNPLKRFQEGRNARRITDLMQIRRALEIYNVDVGGYPFSNFTAPNGYCDSNLGWFQSNSPSDHCYIGPLGPGSNPGQPVPGDYWYSTSNLQPLVVNGHISRLPTDPSGAGAKTHYYMYKPCKDGRGYLLRGVLENPLRPHWGFTHQNLMMDKDNNGTITAGELTAYKTCEGANLSTFPECIHADWDGDGDVDIADTALGAPFAGKATCS